MALPGRVRALLVVLTALFLASTGLSVALAADTYTLGTPLAVSITTSGQGASYTFAGEEGKPLLGWLDDQRFTGGPPDESGVSVRVLDPTGFDIGAVGSPGSGTGSIRSLPSTGTYTLKIVPNGDTVGTATLTVAYPTVTQAALTPGTATTATLARGTDLRYTFSGRSGQRFGALVTKYALTSTRNDIPPRAGFALFRPDGSTFWTPSDDGPGGGLGLRGPGWQEAPPLDATGTWTLEIQPDQWVTGSITFTPRVTSGLNGGAVGFDQPFTAKVGTPGQWIRYAITATPGLRPTLTEEKATWRTADRTPTSAGYFLLRPDGTRAGQFSPSPVDDGTSWGETGNTFDVGGTWTLLVDPAVDATGSARLTLHQVKDVTGTLTLGRRKNVAITQRGQDVIYRFAWNGQGALAWSTDLSGDLVLFDPDGNAISSARAQVDSSSGTLTGNGTAGTWRIRYDPGAWIGTGRLMLKAGA